MKSSIKIFIFLLTIIVHFVSFAQRTNSHHVSVKAYTRSNGTYVPSHNRTAPNSTNRDNFSTIGNTNPYTGQVGWIQPDNKPLINTQKYSYPSTTKSYQTSSTQFDLDAEVNRILNAAKSESYSYPPITESYQVSSTQSDLSAKVNRILNAAKSENYSEQLKRESDLEIKAATSKYNYPTSSTYFSSGSFVNTTSDLSTYKSFSINTVSSKTMNNIINYYNKYSWNDKFMLEKALYKLGYDVGSIDGIIEQDTIDAIKEFQRDNELSVDGKAGDKTIDRLASKLRE